MDEKSDRTPRWHGLSVAETAARLRTDAAAGLTDAEAARRLARDGPNRLPEQKPRPLWRLFARQFHSVLTLVLIAAAVLAAAIGDLLDAGVILAVVVFNAFLGFHQEHRAERILDALRAMLAPTADVRRDGGLSRLPSERVVPGDVVVLEPGDRVPADGRLSWTQGLEIDESSLTGESVAAIKHARALDDDPPLAERTNLAYANTVVTRGRGEMLVTATGIGTEMGRMVGLLQAVVEEDTPLQRKLDQLGKILAAIAVGVIAVIVVMGLWRGDDPATLVLTAIALAVAAIPEGLPAVVTVTLAIGMYAMTRRNALVKRLAAVETLGCTTVICTDKTGTLTLNQMTARRVVCAGRRFAVDGVGYGGDGAIHPPAGAAVSDLAPLLRAAALCNDSHVRDGVLIGDPTEGALLALALRGGGGDPRPDLPRLAELPFESETRIMATAHALDGRVLVCVKGAPDALLDRCDRHLGPDGPVALDAAGREALRHEVEALGAEALRVLALAEGDCATAEFDAFAGGLGGLTLLGLVGIMDPPRPTVRQAVAECRHAGIAVKMITGDHRVTAAAIARELDIGGAVVTGVELDRTSDAALAERIDAIGVFARVAPEHKVRIVQALRRGGHIVAMTGDGVNDAPALRSADIGIAMGASGTDVAREAATMVLTDDDFASIVGAVRQGRTIYDNIVKFLRFQLSTNVGALLTVFTAPLVGLPPPFTPIQILWVNIIMDGPPAMALAFDPPRRDVMDEPPRPPDAPILGWRRMGRLAIYGITMMAGTLGVFHVALAAHGETYARTLAFTTFVLFQFFNVFNARVGRASALNRDLGRNGKLWLALASVLVLQVVAVYWPPAQAVFQTTALTAGDWLIAVAVAASVLVLDEARKLLGRLGG